MKRLRFSNNYAFALTLIASSISRISSSEEKNYRGREKKVFDQISDTRLPFSFFLRFFFSTCTFHSNRSFGGLRRNFGSRNLVQAGAQSTPTQAQPRHPSFVLRTAAGRTQETETTTNSSPGCIRIYIVYRPAK